LRDLVGRIEGLEVQLHSFSANDNVKVTELNGKLKDLCQKLEATVLFN